MIECGNELLNFCNELASTGIVESAYAATAETQTVEQNGEPLTKLRRVYLGIKLGVCVAVVVTAMAAALVGLQGKAGLGK